MYQCLWYRDSTWDMKTSASVGLGAVRADITPHVSLVTLSSKSYNTLDTKYRWPEERQDPQFLKNTTLGHNKCDGDHQSVVSLCVWHTTLCVLLLLYAP